MLHSRAHHKSPIVVLAALLAFAVIAAPTATRLFDAAVGATGPLQPYTSLAFEDPFGAAFGLIPEQPIGVVVGNSTGVDSDLSVRVSDGRGADELILVSLKDGATTVITVTPRLGATELKVSIDNRPRPVEIRAEVLP